MGKGTSHHCEMLILEAQVGGTEAVDGGRTSSAEACCPIDGRLIPSCHIPLIQAVEPIRTEGESTSTLHHVMRKVASGHGLCMGSLGGPCDLVADSTR
jgi:hypothetical protein